MRLLNQTMAAVAAVLLAGHARAQAQEHAKPLFVDHARDLAVIALPHRTQLPNGSLAGAVNDGTDASRRRVYGCRGAAKTVSGTPSSTSFPRSST